ncbi:JAB domain-containing protein [Feifania hominis]|uniref:DNA repair protein RadC n=1 Tax=Feifania hominis TaxID=2763660 RepID=A0A926DBJ2_9FIRM|nr:DNA repair protein RadC [Feifania hominis]MBC8535508.1 DNA repair protein RadC [Feifania hominis]
MHDGHRDRVKRRFLSEGLDGFYSHEALELLLYYAIPRRDTNSIAHELIATFGTVANVFEAPYEELLRVPNVGESAATLIKLIPELSRFYLDSKYENLDTIDTTEKACNFLTPKFIGRKEEVVYLVCLDNKRKILNCQIIYHGSVNSAQINVRKIVETVLKYNASGVILAHNHPGGLALPSEEDVRTTERINQALAALNIDLLDHIVVADYDSISFMDSGFIRRPD